MDLLLKRKYPLQLWANNPILRLPADPIQEVTADIRKFAHDLVELMRIYEGVWLAAPQVWQSLRIIATTQWKESKKWQKNTGEIVMINPEIIEKSEQLILSDEACLSLPGETGTVRRHKSITVSYLDPEGKKHTKKFDDFNATVVQHEIDHIDGVLFIDKTVKTKKI